MFACEKAVKIAHNNGLIRNNRGFARGLISDFNGAIEDFEVFIKSTDNAEKKAQQQGGIEFLKKKENSFTFEGLDNFR
ncbi:tetratricopeptide repeat protein [Dapis sp. BLCC M229]|uniref:tetratricopeptide repeat protein n=1 Tax=Dapis sp. BLCC M229 TaxID=3400188 RepID=UPI003CF59F98